MLILQGGLESSHQKTYHQLLCSVFGSLITVPIAICIQTDSRVFTHSQLYSKIVSYFLQKTCCWFILAQENQFKIQVSLQ